jgi:hypothetical protein
LKYPRQSHASKLNSGRLAADRYVVTRVMHSYG